MSISRTSRVTGAAFSRGRSCNPDWKAAHCPLRLSCARTMRGKEHSGSFETRLVNRNFDKNQTDEARQIGHRSALTPPVKNSKSSLLRAKATALRHTHRAALRRGGMDMDNPAYAGRYRYQRSKQSVHGVRGCGPTIAADADANFRRRQLAHDHRPL